LLSPPASPPQCNALGGEKLELLGLRGRREPDAAAVADAVLAREPAHLVAYRSRLRLGGIGPAAVEPLGLWRGVGPGTGEAVEVVLPRAGLEVERVRPAPARAGLARRANDVREQLRPVRDARKDRREADGGADAGLDEPREGTQALAGRRRSRLGSS